MSRKRNQMSRLEYETEPDVFAKEMDVYSQHCSNCTFCIIDNKGRRSCGNPESECFNTLPKDEWCWAWKQRTKTQIHWDKSEEDIRRRIGDEQHEQYQ